MKGKSRVEEVDTMDSPVVEEDNLEVAEDNPVVGNLDTLEEEEDSNLAVAGNNLVAEVVTGNWHSNEVLGMVMSLEVCCLEIFLYSLFVG